MKPPEWNLRVKQLLVILVNNEGVNHSDLKARGWTDQEIFDTIKEVREMGVEVQESLIN